MRISDFKMMAFSEQKEVLKRFGIFSHDRYSSENGKRSVYQVFGFMVEVNYYFNNKIHYIRVLDKNIEGQFCPVEKIRIHLN
ncbi:MAG: hypothetical protein ACI8XB_000529 [Patiriisocius sp.]|jgi:hypothetical protein